MSNACPAEEDLYAILAGDPAAAHWEAHVKTCDSCRATFGQLQAGLQTLHRWSAAQTILREPPMQSLPDETTPTFLDRYFVAGIYGETPEAVVYRAAHVLVQTPVLIFRLRANASEAAREELVRFAKRLAAVEHPGVARTLDLSFDGDRPLLITELPVGEKLAKLLSVQNSPQPKRIALVFAAAARALAALHDADLAHGGLRPESILVQPDGQVVLIGAGIRTLSDLAGKAVTVEPASAADAPSADNDVFKLGAILLDPKNAGPSGQSIADSLRRYAARPLWEKVQGSTNPDPDWRPSADELAQVFEGMAMWPHLNSLWYWAVLSIALGVLFGLSLIF